MIKGFEKLPPMSEVANTSGIEYGEHEVSVWQYFMLMHPDMLTYGSPVSSKHHVLVTCKKCEQHIRLEFEYTFLNAGGKHGYEFQPDAPNDGDEQAAERRQHIEQALWVFRGKLTETCGGIVG